MKIQTEIDWILEKVNNQMSTYRAESEISRFNRYNKTDWFDISADVVLVMEQAIQTSEESNGAFDITVSPLVNIWGFGPRAKKKLIPDQSQIDSAWTLVGYSMLAVRQYPPSVRKGNPRVNCDLSAIAKGFGVDKVYHFLDTLGINNFLVEIGGEVRAKGRNSENKFWKIGISTPDNTFGIQKVVSLENIAVATSGDYRNYFEKDGIRYSHTIDPRSGRPITHKLASVTVLHPQCMIADALATAIDVLGPDAGYQFAMDRKLPVFMIVKDKAGFIEKMTPEFEEILKLN